MKKILLICILLIVNTLTFAQSEKCINYTKTIVATANLKMVAQTSDYAKAMFPAKHNYALEDIKSICDTTMKSKPTGWINNRENYEKEYVVDGKKMLIVIYWNDEYLYFEY